MENPKELFEGFIKTAVSPVLVADAIELYARQEIVEEADREDFTERYSDEAYQPILKKAVLDAVVSIVAALEVDDEAAFRGVITLLDVEEEDDVISKMKVTMLDKLAEDACSDLSEFDEQRVRARVNYVKALVA